MRGPACCLGRDTADDVSEGPGGESEYRSSGLAMSAHRGRGGDRDHTEQEEGPSPASPRAVYTDMQHITLYRDVKGGSHPSPHQVCNLSPTVSCTMYAVSLTLRLKHLDMGRDPGMASRIQTNRPSVD